MQEGCVAHTQLSWQPRGNHIGHHFLPLDKLLRTVSAGYCWIQYGNWVVVTDLIISAFGCYGIDLVMQPVLAWVVRC